MDSEFYEVLVDRWFWLLWNFRVCEVVVLMLCFFEYGGMVISVRDWFGGEECMGVFLKFDMGIDEDEDESEEEEKLVLLNGFGSLFGGGIMKIIE